MNMTMDGKMRVGSSFILSGIVLGSALGLAGCVSPSVNASGVSRQAAITACVDKARREVPSDLRNVQQPRYYIYISCMRQQGFEP